MERICYSPCLPSGPQSKYTHRNNNNKFLLTNSYQHFPRVPLSHSNPASKIFRKQCQCASVWEMFTSRIGLQGSPEPRLTGVLSSVLTNKMSWRASSVVLCALWCRYFHISSQYPCNLTQYNYIDNVMWLIYSTVKRYNIILILITNDYNSLLNSPTHTGAKLWP